MVRKDTRKNLKVSPEVHATLERLKKEWKKKSVNEVILEMFKRLNISIEKPAEQVDTKKEVKSEVNKLFDLVALANDINQNQNMTRMGLATHIYKTYGYIEVPKDKFTELLKMSPRAIDIFTFDESKNVYVVNKDLVVS